MSTPCPITRIANEYHRQYPKRLAPYVSELERIIDVMRNLGWTVEEPKPKYRASLIGNNGAAVWMGDVKCIATFVANDRDWNLRAAERLRDSLNREEGSV